MRGMMKRGKHEPLLKRFVRFFRRMFRWRTDTPQRIRSDVERYNFEALNRERMRHGLNELHNHHGYADLSRGHSQAMARSGNIFHSDNPRRTNCSYSGENVAVIPMGRVKGFRHPISTERDVALALHQMWIHSPGHRKNMLDPRFGQVGIGIHRRGNRYYATQLFSS